jgi:hypothetical protein
MPDVATKARGESPIKIGAKIRRTARDRVRQWGAPVEALAFYEAFLVDETSIEHCDRLRPAWRR